MNVQRLVACGPILRHFEIFWVQDLRAEGLLAYDCSLLLECKFLSPVFLHDKLFIGILQLRVGNNALFFILESANSAMVTDPVLGVFAERWNFNLIVAIDSCAPVFSQAFHLLKFFGTDEDFLLGHFYYGAVEVLEEEAALL